MNKSDLIDAVARQSRRLENGDTVAWPGSGSSSTSWSEARTGRIPQTGEAVEIAASTRMKFTPEQRARG